MHKQLMIPALLIGLVLMTTQAFAQSGTVLLRSGDRLNVEVLDMGADFTFRVNGQERHFPINNVVLIDFAGDARNLPQAEVARVSNDGPMIVTRSGEIIPGSLADLRGIPTQAELSNGRRVDLSNVARIYASPVAGIGGIPHPTTQAEAPAPGTPAAPPGSRTVVVPGNVAWTNTGFNVPKGQRLHFQPSGEVRLSFNGDDVATAAGAKSYRFADKAPIRTIPIGALIGRIGNGQPFSIGNPEGPYPMPASGRLYLGINDDHLADNSGNYVVHISQ
jgi:hypothetical protein